MIKYYRHLDRPKILVANFPANRTFGYRLIPLQVQGNALTTNWSLMDGALIHLNIKRVVLPIQTIIYLLTMTFDGTTFKSI